MLPGTVRNVNRCIHPAYLRPGRVWLECHEVKHVSEVAQEQRAQVFFLIMHEFGGERNDYRFASAQFDGADGRV